MRLPLRTLVFAALACCACSVFIPDAASATGSHSATFTSSDRKTDDIRVLISGMERSSSIRIESAGGAYRVSGDSRTETDLTSGQRLTIRRDGNRLQVDAGGHSFSASSIRIDGPGGLRFTDTGTAYAGTLEIYPGRGGSGLRVVNRLPIEEYVASVVGSEYGLHDEEGAKAMAVAARTYALYALSDEDGGILKDDERSQMYRGMARATAEARKAAYETAGLVLTRNGALVEAVYSASNGGMTAANESVWDSQPEPYLRSRKDPYDGISPYSSWNWEIEENRLHDALTRTYGFEIREVTFDRPGEDGRIRSVRLRGKGKEKTISGSAFRAFVASHFGDDTLRSTFFEAESRRGSYRFEGGGFGHGVGLSQWGAHAMALDGHSFRDILDFYYTGVELDQLYRAEEPMDLRLDLPVLAEAAVADSPSLSEISDDLQTPQINNSISVEKNSRRPLTAKTVWGLADRKSTDDAPKKRRVGW